MITSHHTLLFTFFPFTSKFAQFSSNILSTQSLDSSGNPPTIWLGFLPMGLRERLVWLSPRWESILARWFRTFCWLEVKGKKVNRSVWCEVIIWLISSSSWYHSFSLARFPDANRWRGFWGGFSRSRSNFDYVHRHHRFDDPTLSVASHRFPSVRNLSSLFFSLTLFFPLSRFMDSERMIWKQDQDQFSLVFSLS